MKLVKNGTVLLAAIGAFTMTSCGGNLTKEQARDWLKDVNVEDAKKAEIDSEDYAWNLSVTGTGMTPGEKEGGTYGGVQYLLAYLIDSNELSKNPTVFLENFKDLTGNFNDKHRSGDIPGEGGFEFINQEIFDVIIERGANHTFMIKNNLLHIKFDYQFDISLVGIKLPFNEELTVAKDGFVKEDVKTFSNAEVIYDQSPVKAKGTFSGTVTHKINYKNIN